MTYSHENGCQLCGDGLNAREFDSHISNIYCEHISTNDFVSDFIFVAINRKSFFSQTSYETYS